MGLDREIRRKNERKQRDEIRDIFFSPLEEITDELMEELVIKGWDKDSLKSARKEGFFYNRTRNSVMK